MTGGTLQYSQQESEKDERHTQTSTFERFYVSIIYELDISSSYKLVCLHTNFYLKSSSDKVQLWGQIWSLKIMVFRNDQRDNAVLPTRFWEGWATYPDVDFREILRLNHLWTEYILGVLMIHQTIRFVTWCHSMDNDFKIHGAHRSQQRGKRTSLPKFAFPIDY